MRKKIRLAPSAVMLMTGLASCLIVASLQDDLHSLIHKIKYIDYVKIEGIRHGSVIISDYVFVQQLLKSLKNATLFQIEDSFKRPTEETQICFYADKSRFVIKLLRNDKYGYFIKINNYYYKSDLFSSLIVSKNIFYGDKMAQSQ